MPTVMTAGERRRGKEEKRIKDRSVKEKTMSRKEREEDKSGGVDTETVEEMERNKTGEDWSGHGGNGEEEEWCNKKRST